MRKICIFLCFCCMFSFSTAFAKQDVLANLNWDMTYDELKEKYQLIYNNHLDEENSNTYWLKINEPYLNGKEVMDSKVLLFFKDNKLYRIMANFTDGTDWTTQKNTAKEINVIGENLYWGASLAQVNRFYKLKYKQHDMTENAPVYYMTLPKKNFNGEELKSNEVLIYFWNDQLYKIIALKKDGTQYVLQDDFLGQKAMAQGRLNAAVDTHNKAVEKMNEEIVTGLPADKKNVVGIIPNLYWGESINDIASDYTVKYMNFYRDENSLVYELNLKNLQLKKDKTYNDFRRKFQRDIAKVRLFLWNNQLYRIEIEYTNKTKRIFNDEKILNRAVLDGEVYKLGSGNFLKHSYREIYKDVVDGKLYMYWGQSLKEFCRIYELNGGGINWHTIGIFSVKLSNTYKEGLPYLIVMFSNGQLYKILLCFDENIRNRKQGQMFYAKMKETLTEKFGKSAVYRKDILMWQSMTVSVNKEEEDFLKSFLDETIIRTAHFLADELKKL